MLNVLCSAHLDHPVFDSRYNGNNFIAALISNFWKYRTEVIVNLYAVFLFQIYFGLKTEKAQLDIP